MLENIFGNIQQQQADLQAKLKDILVEAESGDGAVTVTAGADLHIANIKLDPTKLDWNDREQVEDLLVVAVNRALEVARQKAGTETGKLIEGMFPFGDMKDFMGGAQ